MVGDPLDASDGLLSGCAAVNVITWRSIFSKNASKTNKNQIEHFKDRTKLIASGMWRKGGMRRYHKRRRRRRMEKDIDQKWDALKKTKAMARF